MKGMHVHRSVEDLAHSIRFYSTLFAAEPTVVKPDDAKWMLEDPRVNFAISTCDGRAAGVDHLGIEVEDVGELHEVKMRLDAAERPVLNESQTTCCYARSEKSCTADPAGIVWEAFHTVGEITTYGTSAPLERITGKRSCCG